MTILETYRDMSKDLGDQNLNHHEGCFPYVDLLMYLYFYVASPSIDLCVHPYLRVQSTHTHALIVLNNTYVRVYCTCLL